MITSNIIGNPTSSRSDKILQSSDAQSGRYHSGSFSVVTWDEVKLVGSPTVESSDQNWKTNLAKSLTLGAGQFCRNSSSIIEVTSRQLILSFKEKIGYIIYNGVPIGVEVNHSKRHRGPFPATTDSRFTSVWTQAIKRFVMPLAYQDWPPEILPPALQPDNPLGMIKTIIGRVILPY